jgi:hypothetical protein
MRTSLFVRFLAAAAATSVVPLVVLAAAPSHRGRVPMQVRAASTAADVHVAPPPSTTASTAVPPVGTFDGVRYGPLSSEVLDLDLPERSVRTGAVPVIVYLQPATI